jgi:hypothetical protein
MKLYDAKEGSIRDIATRIDVHQAQLFKLKDWLIQRKILIYQGKYKVRRGFRQFEVEFYVVNKKAIDYLLFKVWKETGVLFDRSHEYLDRNDFDEY